MAKPKKPKAPKKAKKSAPGSADSAQAPAKKGIKGLLGQATTLAVLGVAAFGAVYLLPQPSQTVPAAPSEIASGSNHTQPYNFDREIEFAPLNGFTISLRDGQTILKMGIVLEVYAGTSDGIDPQDPQIRNAFMGYLRAIQVEQIRDPAFMNKLRVQLRRRARLVLGEHTVKDILITDFILQ